MTTRPFHFVKIALKVNFENNLKSHSSPLQPQYVGKYATIENILRVDEELRSIYRLYFVCVRVCSIIIGRERKGGTYFILWMKRKLKTITK